MTGVFNYESLLKASGGFGWYQLLLLAWFQTSIVVVTCNMGFMVFASIEPEYVTLTAVNDSTLLSSDNGSIFTNLEVVFDSIVSEWDLHGRELTFLPSLLISVQMFGVLIGGLSGGLLSDRFGRKIVCFGGLVLLVSSGFATGFADDWPMFTPGRLLVGIGLGTVISVQYVLITEQLTQRLRLLVYIGGWPFGYIVLGLTALFIRDWRNLTFVTNTYGLIPLFLLYFVYESPKWLLERGRTEEALSILEQIRKRNARETREYDRRIRSETRSWVHQNSVATSAKTKVYTYVHLFRNRQATMETLTIMLCWMAISMSNYGINTQLNAHFTSKLMIFFGILFNMGQMTGDTALNMLTFAIPRLFLNVSINFCDRKLIWLGRRTLLFIAFIGLNLCLWSVAVIQAFGDSRTLPRSATALAGIGLVIGSCVWLTVELFSVELFPTVLRNMGNAACNTAARIGSTLAPLILYSAFIWTPAPYVVFGVMTTVALVVAWLVLPETKGKPLPDLETENEQEETTV